MNSPKETTDCGCNPFYSCPAHAQKWLQETVSKGIASAKLTPEQVNELLADL